VSKGRLVSFWKTSEELTYRITIALSKAFGDMPATGWIRGSAVASDELLAQNNQLRNLVDKLRAENEELRERVKPRLDGIAGLNESFTIRYRYTVTIGTTRYRDHVGTVVLTWAEIVAACAPKFLRPTSPGVIGPAIIQYIRENKQIGQDDMKLFDSDENRIKVHLMALNLIEVEAAQAEGGGVQEFASLTPRGRQVLVELLAVRGTEPGSITA
jgi:hypothetical protein